MEDDNSYELEKDDQEGDAGEDVQRSCVGHRRRRHESVQGGVHGESDQWDKCEQQPREKLRSNDDFTHGRHDDEEDAWDVPLEDVAAYFSCEAQHDLHAAVCTCGTSVRRYNLKRKHIE